MTQNADANTTITVEDDLNVAVLEDPTVVIDEALAAAQDTITVGQPIAIHQTAVEGVLCAR